MFRRSALLAVFLSKTWTTDAQAAPGDPVAGATLAAACSACHALESGGKQKWGPSLVGVLDRPVGAQEGYRYGSYLEAGREAGDTWTEPRLRAWLVDSKAVARAADARTKMPAQQLTDDQLDDLVSYLRSLR
ncbi:MAG: c-type cytochrome [Myxococcales bacterium]|nr:c-type cytochrome [Myxococcales bacterium]